MADEQHDEQHDEPEAPETGPTSPEPEPEELEADEDETGQEEAKGTADEPEAVTDPRLLPPATEKEAEKRQTAWDKGRAARMDAAEKADGYRYSRSSVCPLCDGHGLMWTPETPEEQAQMRGFVLALVGEATPEEFHDHPTYHRCETCDGYGKVRTGSRVPSQEALNCPDCNGQGHTGGRSNVTALPAPPPPGVPTEAVPQAEQERIGPDAWGRPPGHPHYAKLPAEVV